MPRFQLAPTSPPGSSPKMKSSMRRAAALVALLLAIAGPAAAAGGTLEIFPDSRVLVLIVLFVALVWPANKLLFEPMLGVMDERRQRIDGTRARAAEIGSEADTVLGRYESAVGEARGQAETLRRGALEQVRRESSEAGGTARSAAEVEVSRARGELASALGQARGELRTQAEGLARDAAAQVLGRSLQ